MIRYWFIRLAQVTVLAIMVVGVVIYAYLFWRLVNG